MASKYKYKIKPANPEPLFKPMPLKKTSYAGIHAGGLKIDWTDEALVRLREMYDALLSLREIAGVFSINYGSVKSKIDDENYPLRDMPLTSKPTGQKHDVEHPVGDEMAVASKMAFIGRDYQGNKYPYVANN